MQQMPCSCMQLLLGSSSSCKMHCMMYMHRTQTGVNNVATRSCTITTRTWDDCTGSTWFKEEGTSRKQAGLTEANPPLFEEETRPLKMPAGWPCSPAPETTAKPDSDTPPITTSSNGPHTFAKPCAHQYKLLTSYEKSKKQTQKQTSCMIS